MSYDIDVVTPDGQEFEMNWLRNPFGLCGFAEDNVGDGNMSLWHVCNDHAYDAVKDLDRAKFLRVVEDYWDRLRGLQRGWFWFTFGSYVQFSYDHAACMRVNFGGKLHEWTKKNDVSFLKLDIARFEHDQNWEWSGRNIEPLQFYKNWFEQLLELARAMQDPNATVCITK